MYEIALCRAPPDYMIGRFEKIPGMWMPMSTVKPRSWAAPRLNAPNALTQIFEPASKKLCPSAVRSEIGFTSMCEGPEIPAPSHTPSSAQALLEGDGKCAGEAGYRSS